MQRVAEPCLFLNDQPDSRLSIAENEQHHGKIETVDT